MLISRVSDNVSEGGAGGAREESAHSHEYQTANELFELMAKNHNFDEVSESDTLTARDLVILYKNIDIGTRLMSTANELKHKKPNQHVETVVHDEDADSDGSDVSEIYSFEDLQDVVMINKERIDMLTNHSSLENTLCHKLGDLEIQSSDLTTEYDKHFIFKDPYIKEQLKNFNFKYNAQEFGESILPASLLDYICCKRLEDNYNFYMDNIIKYVKHTIDQLKRISNGDYLTDKAKEKWREVEHKVKENVESDTKVLATSTSIPLHVERKVSGHASTWDDLVHSEVDIRSLSKILEKKIIVEVPKLLCGSYTLFSKRCADNLIISCKREEEPANDKCEPKNGESRVDVVFQLQRSQSGQVISNINSIMILKTAPTLQPGISASKLLPLPYKNSMEMIKEKKVAIVELAPERNDVQTVTFEESHLTSTTEETDQEQPSGDAATDNSDYPCSENDCSVLSENISNPELSPSGHTLRDILDKKKQIVHSDAEFNVLSPDELRIRMQRLNTQTALLEESEDTISTANKKKSPTRVRIKSPYENQSFIMEEKKRKKLLEIREKREKKKMALSETCKVSKHKYGKGIIMPQPSSSVTKLSITNKSFYNSIYGQTVMNIDNKQQRRKGLKKDSVVDTDVERDDDEINTPMLTPDKNNKKFTNRSYYLDEAVTEMMYLDMKQDSKDTKESSACTSAVSTDFQANLTLLSQLIGASSTDLSKKQNSLTPVADKSDRFRQVVRADLVKETGNRELTSSQSILNVVPMNSPKDAQLEDIKNQPKKSSSSVECRKSIDKIYGLMKNLGKNDDSTEHKLVKSKFTTASTDNSGVNYPQGASTVQGSDSGTSLKHHLTSSNPSCFSFEKPIQSEVPKPKNSASKKSEGTGSVVPKVIISSKVNNITKTDVDKTKKERKKVITSPTKIPENPLKAISQLLHEFENVQKNRHRPNTDPKPPKKYDVVSNETRSGIIRQNAYKRRSRLDQHLRDCPPNEKYLKPVVKEMKTKQGLIIEVPKIPHQQVPTEEKHERLAKKKIVDILDEVKEARGEAVRGPSKLNRLNSLAQPKRSYVQAHSEEFQTRYGRNVMADRLQRLAATPAPAIERPSFSITTKNKQKRGYPEPSPTTARQPPSMSPLERIPRSRRASSTSPSKPAISPAVIPTHKQNNTIEPSPPETLKKNMVESYVKNHYGRETPGIPAKNLLPSVPKARVPLFPNDLDLISTSSSPILEESTELGSKLHFIINTIINKEPSLTVLTECQEINSNHSKESMNLDANEDLHCPENSSSSSAGHVDIFHDKNVVTTIANHGQQCLKLQDEIVCNIPEQEPAVPKEVLPFSSTTEIEKLENALYRKISVGTFQSRLRIKKLTLTPKQSMQQVFFLQSGDAGSMLLKSSISQIKIKETNEKITDLKVYPTLSSTHISWNLPSLPRNTSIPMQITTVGYAFPQYGSDSKTNSLLGDKSENTPMPNNKMDKVSQCFKGEHADVRSDHGIQADIAECDTENDESPKSDTIADDVITISTVNSRPADFIETNERIKAQSQEKDKTGETSDTQFTQTIDNEVHNVKQLEPIIVRNNAENVTYTSSLDVLVGLLNEIQKITTCQTHISQTNDQECKELECILKDAAILEQRVDNDKTPDLVSISSLDKLRQLESTPSLYSFYLSNNGDRDLIYKTNNSNRVNNGNDVMSVTKTIYADKEVSVECMDREFMNRFTEAPSQFFPITVNHSTNVTNSLLGALSESSSTSTMYSFAEICDTMSIINVNSQLDVCAKIKELPQEENTEDTSCLVVVPEVKLETEIYLKQIRNNTLPDLNKENDVTVRKIIPWNNKLSKDNLVVRASEFDPAIKIKRDILVTLYSILVFTVFAALSFPEMLYY